MQEEIFPATLLPARILDSADAWRGARRDLEAWRPALQAVCRRHGLDSRSLDAAAAGTGVVIRSGDAVIKIFRPQDARDCLVEARALEILARRLPVPVPALLGRGAVGPCAYAVMTSLEGEPLADVWERLDGTERRRVVEEAGRAARALHDLPVGDPGPLQVDWERFLQEQRRTAAERQQSLGLEPALAAQIDRFLDRHQQELESPSRLCLLHTELMRDHLLVAREKNGWRLSGIFDFADALVGAPPYELPAVGLFLTGGEPRLLRAFLCAYGFDAARLTSAFSSILLAWTLCHRYANLPWFRERLPAAGPVTSIEDLARGWFGLDDSIS